MALKMCLSSPNCHSLWTDVGGNHIMNLWHINSKRDQIVTPQNFQTDSLLSGLAHCSLYSLHRFAYFSFCSFGRGICLISLHSLVLHFIFFPYPVPREKEELQGPLDAKQIKLCLGKQGSLWRKLKVIQGAMVPVEKGRSVPEVPSSALGVEACKKDGELFYCQASVTQSKHFHWLIICLLND